MYILRDENKRIIAYTKDQDSVSDAKILSGCKNCTVEYTKDDVVQNGSGFYLKSEFEEYKKSEDYKYDVEKAAAEDEILLLKEKLKEGDYKIIKTIEAKLLSEELPYDVETLTNERKMMRKRINELQGGFVF